MSCELPMYGFEVGFSPIKLVVTATSLEGSEKQLQPYSTVPVNSVKIGQYIDAEIIGLTEVVKNII